MTLVQLNILFYATAALLLLLSVAVALVQWRQERRTANADVPVEAGARPSDLPPAAAGMLVRIGRHNEDALLTATIFDLAGRGYLSIVHAPDLVAARLAETDSAFMLLRAAETAEPTGDFLRPYEAALLNSLFHGAYLAAVPLPLALRTYHETQESGNSVSDSARAVLLQRRLIDVRKRTVHLIALGLLIPLFVACIGVTVALLLSPGAFVDWSGLATLAACAALELLIISLMIVFDLRLRTPVGRVEARRWQDYMRGEPGARAMAYRLAFGEDAAALIEKLDTAPVWLREGEIDVVERDNLPKPEAVAEIAGRNIARLRPNPTPLSDAATARALLTAFVAALHRAKRA